MLMFSIRLNARVITSGYILYVLSQTIFAYEKYFNAVFSYEFQLSYDIFRKNA